MLGWLHWNRFPKWIQSNDLLALLNNKYQGNYVLYCDRFTIKIQLVTFTGFAYSTGFIHNDCQRFWILY
jgi:hypothetical protein